MNTQYTSTRTCTHTHAREHAHTRIRTHIRTKARTRVRAHKQTHTELDARRHFDIAKEDALPNVEASYVDFYHFRDAVSRAHHLDLHAAKERGWG